LSSVSKVEVVAAAAVKKFRELIETYEGPKEFEPFKAYLLKHLGRMETRGDQLLADIIDQILL